LEREIVRQLMVTDTRPFLKKQEDSFLAFLRGVNLNPDSKPERMIMLRVFARKNLIITVRRRPLKAIKDVIIALNESCGAESPAMTLALIIEKLIDRMWPVYDQIEQALSQKEDVIFTEKLTQFGKARDNLSEMRLQILQLHRYIRPMGDTLKDLANATDIQWLGKGFYKSLEESTHRLTQIVEDIDHFKSRAEVLSQELLQAQEERTGRAAYVLTVVATLFLPASLIAGIYGMNAHPIPLSDPPYGFWIAIGFIILSILIPYILLQKYSLIPQKRG